ncbi:MAG: replicative DNA helicase [Phycisphaerales bacterium]|nr:replicative DNA helicase [Phycisphaerales bacterium]
MDNANNTPVKGTRKSRTKTNQSSIDINPLITGKIPPQSKDIEEAVIGAILLEKGAFDVVKELNLTADCFYEPAHQTIFGVMESMQINAKNIDSLTVSDELKKQGKLAEVGGYLYLVKLTQAVVSAAHIESHTRILIENYIKRRLIVASTETISESYQDGSDVFNLLDATETRIFELTAKFLKTGMQSIESILADVHARIDLLRTRKSHISGIPSGFNNLDRTTHGWQPSNLIILAARPSMGKTAFALNLAMNAVFHPTEPVPVAFFSLEMGAEELAQRLISMVSQVSMGNIKVGNLHDDDYNKVLQGMNKLAGAKLIIDDTASINIFEFRAKARRLVNKDKVGMIVIDFLQLMSGMGERNTNREQEISTISRNLKILSKELKIPIIALSQLNRQVDTRKESKMPQLSDLRESGAIEQDADMVIFFYRPEYYEQTQDPFGESTKGKVELKIAKHRNGSLETFAFNAKLDIQLFEEIGVVGSDGNIYNNEQNKAPSYLKLESVMNQEPREIEPDTNSSNYFG